MIGNVIAPFEGVYIEPFNPDNCFDPTTHIATEENFMKLLDHGVYDNKYIGYKVQLSNSVDYNNGLWVIADVNHDSTNTGQSNCYDLIALNCVNPESTFGSNNKYRDSNIRTWLNNTFYNGLSSDIKSHIINIKYNSQGTWYNDDKITIPSFIEVNGTTGTTSTYYDTEGIPYPIFTDNNSRIKNNYWWTRSRRTVGSTDVWRVDGDGELIRGSYAGRICVVPTLRIS